MTHVQATQVHIPGARKTQVHKAGVVATQVLT
jgi:hypothetical protein